VFLKKINNFFVKYFFDLFVTLISKTKNKNHHSIFGLIQKQNNKTTKQKQ